LAVNVGTMRDFGAFVKREEAWRAAGGAALTMRTDAGMPLFDAYAPSEARK